MLARRLTTVLPAMTLTGDPTAVVTTRPFRSPPPVYGRWGADRRGQGPMPGAVPRAHHGVLFLDELPECRRHVLEVLRQPLEEGVTKSPPPGCHGSSPVGRAGDSGAILEDVRVGVIASGQHSA
jgi:Magnesium chelatase, subunit ChlI